MQKDNFFSKTYIVIIGAMICCALWGSAFPCIKIGYNLSNIPADSTASQLLYAGIRFTLAGIMAILLGSIINKKFLYPRPSAVPKVFFLSLFQTILQYFFFYIGLAHTNGVKASIIEGMNVFVAVIISGLIFRMEKINSRKIIGCIIGFAGVFLVNLTGFNASALSNIFSGMALNGELFIFISTIAYAFSSVILKRYSATENTVMLSGYQFVVGGIVMAVAGALMGGRVELLTIGAIMMIVYLALVSALAYSLWGILLKYNPVSKVAVFGFMNPVFGVVLSALLLNEGNTLGIHSVVALLLVCLGIYCVNK